MVQIRSPLSLLSSSDQERSPAIKTTYGVDYPKPHLPLNFTWVVSSVDHLSLLSRKIKVCNYRDIHLQPKTACALRTGQTTTVQTTISAGFYPII